MRLRAAGVGGLAQKLGGALEILREQLALDIEQRQIVGGFGMAEFCGGGEPFGALLAVARAGAAVEREHGEREHGVAVAARGGELVPVGGFLVVARHAEPVGVELAQERHRRRVAFLGVVGGVLQRREEIAALIGAESEVGFLSAGVGRGEFGLRHVLDRRRAARRRLGLRGCRVGEGDGDERERCRVHPRRFPDAVQHVA